MKTMLVRGRYKVVQVLETAPNYLCAQVVDIAERERPTRLLNLYHGTLAGQYAGIYAAMPQNAVFCGWFMVDNGLAAVFVPPCGQPVDRNQSLDWRARMDYADKFVQLALNMADWPPEISCAAWELDNIRMDGDNQRVGLRFVVRPVADASAENLPKRVGELLQTILLSRFAQGDAEATFCARLRADLFHSIVPLYAAWKQAASQMIQEYEALEHELHFKRWCIQACKQIKRTARRWGR